MKRNLYNLLLILVFLLVSSCSSVPPEKQCSVSADCVPDACCHAAGAVNAPFAPDCSDTLCTLECRPETLDCGFGKIQCVKNACVVILE
ncbi:hypothetical protein J4210_04615 [Candidatus Woesearchaeota archaeon]|nr:hypothetical protein [Candidatus Woesearchaeota archaeon]